MEARTSQVIEHYPAGNSECGACGYLIRTSSPNCPECGERIGSQPFNIKRYLLEIGIDTYILLFIVLLPSLIHYIFEQFRPPSDCNATQAQRDLAGTQDLIRMSLIATLLIVVYIGAATGVTRRIANWKFHFSASRCSATNTAIVCLALTCLIAILHGNPVEIADWLYYRLFTS